MTHERPADDQPDAGMPTPGASAPPTVRTGGSDAMPAEPSPADAALDADGPAVGATGARPASAPGGRRMRRLLRGVADRLRRTPEPPRVARVFDGVRDGAPWFAPDHPVVVDQHERDALLALLRSGSIVVHAAQPLRDDLGGIDAVVPASLRSDGAWIWSDATAYHLEHHWIAPDPELVAHLRTAGPAAPIDAATWRRLSAAIRPDAWKGTTWPLD